MNKKLGPKKTISKTNLRHLHDRINNVKKVEDFLPKEKVITLEFPVSELEKLLRGFRYVRDMVIRISPYNHKQPQKHPFEEPRLMPWIKKSFDN